MKKTCVISTIIVSFLMITSAAISFGCSEQSPELTETPHIKTSSLKTEGKDTATIGYDLEAARVNERGAWEDLRLGNEWYNLTKVSPYLFVKPGDTIRVDVEAWGGPKTQITNISIIPELSVDTPWPWRDIFVKKADWPDPLVVPANSIGHDIQTTEFVIPQTIHIPVEIEIAVTYEVAMLEPAPGLQGLIGKKEYSVYPVTRRYDISLGALSDVSIDNAFRIDDWLVTKAQYSSFSIWMSYRSVIDSDIRLISSSGVIWEVEGDVETDQQIGTTTKALIKARQSQSTVSFATPHHETGVEYITGETYLLEIYARYTDFLLTKKSLTYERGEITIKGIDNSWSYDQDTGKHRLQQTTVMVHNGGRFPVAIPRADFAIEDPVSLKTWEWSSGDYYYVNPGDNTLIYKPNITLPSGNKIIHISLINIEYQSAAIYSLTTDVGN
jgi:hypothetical protein